MAGIFDPSKTALSAPSTAGANFTQRGVVDTSTASAIEALGNITHTTIKGVAISELEGTQENVDFVDPTDKELKDITVDDVVADLNLTNIAAARKQGKLTGQAAASLVNSKVKELVNRFPFLSTEIKQAGQRFFQGTGLDGAGIFKEDESLLDKAREAFVRRAVALGADPTQGEEAFMRQAKSLLEQDRIKNEVAFRKANLELDEVTSDREEKLGFNKWSAERSISLQSDISRIIEETKTAPPEQRIERLEALKLDVDAEARRTFDVGRIGNETYNAEFKGLISDRIDLEIRMQRGDISKSYYETQVASSQAMANHDLFSDPLIARAVAAFSIFKNVDPRLIDVNTSLDLKALGSEVTRAVNSLRQARIQGRDPSKTSGITAQAPEEAKMFHSMLRNSMNAVRDGLDSEASLEQANTEISDMLSAYANGIARNGDTFSVQRWDELMDFFGSQDAWDYISKQGENFTPEAREGIKNIIQFEFERQLLRETRAKFEQTLGTAIRTQSIKGIPETFFQSSLGEFVEVNTANGQVSFSLNPDKFPENITASDRTILTEGVTALNRNYGSRINRYVKTLSHLSGNNNYKESLDTLLQKLDIGGAPAPQEAPQPTPAPTPEPQPTADFTTLTDPQRSSLVQQLLADPEVQAAGLTEEQVRQRLGF